MKKKILAVFLSLCMAMSLVPVGAMAAGEETYPDWTSTTSLPSQGTYKLTQNVTINGQVTVNGTLTLDLNGHTITAANSYAFFVQASGSLEIDDSQGTGKVTNQGASGSSKTVIHVNGGGQFTLSGGCIENTTSNGYAVFVNSGSKALIGGGTVVNTGANGYALYVNGSNGNAADVTFSSGTIQNTSNGGKSVYINGVGEFEMTGGTINQEDTYPSGAAIYVNGASQNILVSGGNVTSNCKGIESASGEILVTGGTFDTKSYTFSNVELLWMCKFIILQTRPVCKGFFQNVKTVPFVCKITPFQTSAHKKRARDPPIPGPFPLFGCSAHEELGPVVAIPVLRRGIAQAHLGKVLAENVGPVAVGGHPARHHGLRGGVAGGDVLPRRPIGHAGLGQRGEAAAPVRPGVGVEGRELLRPGLGGRREGGVGGEGGQPLVGPGLVHQLEDLQLEQGAAIGPVKAHEHHRHLDPADGPVGGEGGGGGAVHDPLGIGPGDGRLDLRHVRLVAEVVGVGRRQDLVEGLLGHVHKGELLPGLCRGFPGEVEGELVEHLGKVHPGGGTVGGKGGAVMVPPVLGDDPIGEDVVLVGPHHSVPIVRPFGDVLEGGLAGHRAGDGGGARVAVQDHGEHGPGHAAVGGEGGGTGAVEEPFLHHIVHSVAGPVAVGHVLELRRPGGNGHADAKNQGEQQGKTAFFHGPRSFPRFGNRAWGPLVAISIVLVLAGDCNCFSRIFPLLERAAEGSLSQTGKHDQDDKGLPLASPW